MFSIGLIAILVSALQIAMQTRGANAAAFLKSRSPQSPGSLSGECQNAQVQANSVLPRVISILGDHANQAGAGPTRSALQGARDGLQKSLPGLQAVTAGVNAGTGTNVNNLNAIAEGLVVAQQAFDRAKGQIDTSEDGNLVDIFDQAIEAGQDVVNNCL